MQKGKITQIKSKQIKVQIRKTLTTQEKYVEYV